MRVLHTSGWHLGRMLEGRQRLPEQDQFIDQLCDIASSEQVDMVFVAGDVFDTSNPAAAAEELYFDALETLSDGGSRAVVVIAGNHDSPDRIRAANPLAAKHGISLIGYPGDDLGPGGPAGSARRVCTGPGWLEVYCPKSDQTAFVATLAYPSEARLNEVLGETLDDKERQLAYSDRVSRLLADSVAAAGDGTIRFVLGHLFVAGGRESESERQIQLGGALSVHPQAFGSGVHYVALGHLHRPQVVAASSIPCRYSGSPLTYSFSEADHQKEVILVQIWSWSTRMGTKKGRRSSRMKPLKLEFAGLNSYRARQTVDFQQLGISGLFGIFGPTGSGKSSILDAITLALYGKVDRADNNTRGIINLREKAAEVSFTFEHGGSRYSVQRRYERPSSDPESARAKSARLIKDDAEVLADKPEMVTQTMERIIGLTCQEFCRAVVLPQGKFSEFLTLAGATRAEMLGHIFDLDKFGEPLFQKAVRRRERWQKEVDGLEMTKAELGDCSDDKISESQADADKLQAALLQAEEEHRKAKVEYDEAAGLKALRDQLRIAQERKAALESQKADIEKAQASLDAARRAAPLRNTIGSIKRLTLNRGAKEKGLQIAAVVRDAAQSALDTAIEATRAAREQQDREEPVLTARKTRLEEALEVQRELTELLKKQASPAAALESLKKAVLQERDSVEAREAQLERLVIEVESLRTKQAQLAVDPGVRDLVDEALRLLTPLQVAENERSSTQTDLKKKTSAAEKARSKALEVYGELAGFAASRYTWNDSGDLVVGKVEIPSMKDDKTGEDLLAVAHQEIEVASRLVREADERSKQALIHDHAVVLARSLEEGRPCPVCGSEHHPCVAVGDAERSARAQEAQSVAESCLAKLQPWRKRLQDCASSWDNLRMNELEAWEKVGEREDEVRKARDSFLAAAKAALGNSFSEERAWADIQAAKNQIAGKDKEYASVSRSLIEAQNKEKTVRKELDDARARLSTFERDRDTVAKELTLITEQVDERKPKVQAITGGEDPVAATSAVDSAIQALREPVRQAQAQEDSCRKEAERLGQEVAKLESALSRVEKELQEQKSSLAESLSRAGFDAEDQAEKAMLPDETVQALDKRIQEYRRDYAAVEGQVSQLTEQIGSRQFSESEFRALEVRVKELESRVKTLQAESAVARERLDALKERRKRWDSLEAERLAAEKKRDTAHRLANLLRGKALVKFLAEEHLRDMAIDASTRLGSLTGQRYALEISDGSNFVIRDDYNGGERCSVSTLSGGETFLTSLSLALALSSKVQIRGQYPLGFFFLDEGFGTLDDEKLDAVVSALERLHDKDRMVGVISHVKELKERLPYYLEVVPARGDGTGSCVFTKRS